ncbi:unnamed protein product [Blepharisma stoltei]|uniref:Uncharacterized protein n=1 Tax=Blepharisma stoltei TaxID=1481888 RepID=A0AAU9K6A2_9CILI|nr:unnamed protein product [Blepharisma stoltei]
MSELIQTSLLSKVEKDPLIISPKPKRVSLVPIKPNISNPFISLLENQCKNEEDSIINELQFILTQPEVQKKKLPNPVQSPAFCRAQRPMSRHTSNPIINDALFQELNCS